MTLTTLLPTLRRTLPDPLAHHRWPARTTATTDDVVVDAVSLRGLALLCGTPCVHTAPAWSARAHAAVDPDLVTVVVTRVTAVAAQRDGTLTVELDAELASASPVLAEVRLVGRASTAPVAGARLGSSHPTGADRLGLPADVRPGDLLAVPCDAPTTLRAVLGFGVRLARSEDTWSVR
ncbi:hypothetical protein SAMN04487781_0126 [Cellulosimicrobium cellulans]|nr:hypothetical protein SAMN04487781_0126 [Cellulosimicrobium cellulans]